MSNIDENTIVQKLMEIGNSLATNTEATKNIEKHLETLNGKVATQESFTQTLHTSLDLQSATLQSLVDREKTSKENRSKLTWLTIDNIVKLVFAVVIAFLLFKAGLH